MLKVWGRRSSFNVQKVMWLIGELELPYQHIDAGSDFGGLDTPDFLAGHSLSLDDVTAGTSLYRYFELEIERPQLTQVERWYRSLQEREAFRTHIMIPFGELRGRFYD